MVGSWFGGSFNEGFRIKVPVVFADPRNDDSGGLAKTDIHIWRSGRGRPASVFCDGSVARHVIGRGVLTPVILGLQRLVDDLLRLVQPRLDSLKSQILQFRIGPCQTAQFRSWNTKIGGRIEVTIQLWRLSASTTTS